MSLRKANLVTRLKREAVSVKRLDKILKKMQSEIRKRTFLHTE